MERSLLIIGLVVAYFIVTLGIGSLATKRKSTVVEFFVAKRDLTAPFIIALLFSEMVAGAGTIGNAAQAFGTGLSSVWVNWGYALGCFLMVLFVTKFYKAVGDRLGVMSVPEAYKMRFDNKTRIVLLIILVLAYMISFAIQPLATAALLSPLLGIDTQTLAWIIGIVFIILCIGGGMRGIAWMNFVHTIVMYIAMGVICYFAVKAAGGIGSMRAAVPPEMFSVTQPDVMTVIAWGVGLAVSFFAAATIAAVIFGGRTLKEANKGIIGAGILMIIFPLFPALIGIAGRILIPDAEPNSILFIMANYMGPVLAAICIMGVLAAVLSTGPYMLFISVTTISRDFYRVLRPSATDADELKFTRITAIVLGLIATYLGMHASSILGQLLGAFQIRSVAGLVLIIALYWRRVDSRAAFWSMMIGGAIAAVWHFAGSPLGIAPLWPSVAVGIPLLVILTLMAKKPVDDGALIIQKAMREAEEEGMI